MMTTSTERNRTIRAALELLADQALEGRTDLANPAGYRAEVLAQKRRDHHADAQEILDSAPDDIDPPTLAAMLEPARTSTPAGREPAYDPTEGPRRAQEQLMAENAERLAQIEATPRCDPDIARQRIGQIREELRIHEPLEPVPCPACNGSGIATDEPDDPMHPSAGLSPHAEPPEDPTQ